jgi:hypothetical protein
LYISNGPIYSAVDGENLQQRPHNPEETGKRKDAKKMKKKKAEEKYHDIRKEDGVADIKRIPCTGALQPATLCRTTCGPHDGVHGTHP